MAELRLEIDRMMLKNNMLKPLFKTGMRVAGNIVERTAKLEIPGYHYPQIPSEKFLGFNSSQYASQAVDKAIEMAGGAKDLIIASDIDQTLAFLFDGFEDEALERLLQVRDQGAQVFLQTNRTWMWGTGKIIDHLKGMGFGDDEIYKGMDQQTGVFRHRPTYERYVDRMEQIMKNNPEANMVQIYDVAVLAPIPTPQDLWGGQVLGFTRPLLKDLMARQSPIPGFGFIGINKFTA